MKKYISYLLTLALLVPAFVSCTEQLEDLRSKNQKTHTVYFSTTDRATKTGLSIDGNMVKPDWRKTDVNNIHFFEIDATNAAAPGTADEINLSEGNRTAHFKAAISEEVVIHIDPTTGEEDNSKGAKSSSRVSPFTFAAVVAQQPDKKAYTYVIPSEQHPDAETLKDPNAEFLVGYSRKSYPDRYSYDDNVVDLYFDRVAALGRLAISGFVGSGEKVKSVTITATGGMTGKATYPGDFTLGDKNKVKFTKVNEPLVLNYGDNGVAAPAEGAFYAYFVAAPGEASITSIEVLTDQYKYTKTVEGGASFTFSDEQLLNIDFALSADIAEAVTADNKTWYKASVLEAGYDYLIVSGGQALKNNGNNNVVVAKEVTISENNTIELEDTEGVIWTVADADQSLAANGKFTLKNATEYLYRHGGSSTSTLEASTSPATPKYGVWDYEDGYFFNISTSQGTSIYYAYYDSGWKITTTKTAAMIFTNRPPIEISFSADAAEYDLAGDGSWIARIPSLVPEGMAVTYGSSNEDVATVNTTTGEVTIKGIIGSTVITAIAAGNAEYQGGSASYELTVTDSSIQPKTYRKVTSEAELEIGAKYLLVYETTPSVFKPILDGTTFKKTTDNVQGVTIANSTITSPDLENNELTLVDGYHFYVASAARYIYPLSDSSYNTSLQAEETANQTLSITINNNGTAKIANTSNTAYSFCWSTRSSYFSTTYQESAANIYLYKLDDGRQAQNPKFDPAGPFTVDKATETFTAPVLKDYHGNVTYMSDDENVAKVNPTSGAVEIVGRGEVVISATVEGDADFKPATAYYELEVTDSSVKPKTYHKVTASSDLTVGSQYILVFEGLAGDTDGDADSKVFKPIIDPSNANRFYKHTSNALGVLISNETITSPDFDACHFTLESGYHLKSNALSKYIYSDSGNLGSESATTKNLDITFSEGIATIKTSGTNYYLAWSTYSHYFTSSSGTNATGICLYKLDDGTTPPTPEKQDRELSFGTENVSVILGQAATFPTLSGVTDGGVTYSSSDGTVATINASGVVSVKAAGTTIIKAEAQESDTYLAGSAQYTLTVNPAPGTEKYYVLVTSEPDSWNGKYLIVNTAADGTGIAMNGTGTANVTISGGKIQSTSTIDGYALTVTSAGEVHPNQTDSSQGLIAYDIKFSDGNWLYLYGTSYKQTSETTTSSNRTRHNKCTLLYNNGGVRLMSAGYSVDTDGNAYSSAPSKNYLYYSSSGFTMSSSHASDRVQLYKLDEGGTTPGDGDDPTPTTSKRYTYTSSISAGTYLIGGSESSTYYIAVFPVINKTWTSSNKSYSGEVLNHMVVDANTITTSDEDVINSEVELIASGSGWKIKTKKGQYFAAPTEDYSIPFTDDINSAAVYTISSSSTTTGSYNFYHSGSAAGFTQRKTTGNALRFYKLSE